MVGVLCRANLGIPHPLQHLISNKFTHNKLILVHLASTNEVLCLKKKNFVVVVRTECEYSLYLFINSHWIPNSIITCLLYILSFLCKLPTCIQSGIDEKWGQLYIYTLLYMSNVT